MPSLLVLIAGVFVVLGGVDSFRLVGGPRNRRNVTTETPDVLPICKERGDYCGFAVVHSVTKLQTPIQGWCQCDSESGAECMFAAINARRQWIFTCQRLSRMTTDEEPTDGDEEDEAPARVTFNEINDQYRRASQ